jgi:hypothetical protein
MIDLWIARHDELPALPTERRLLFFTVAWQSGGDNCSSKTSEAYPPLSARAEIAANSDICSWE